jgi:hypothetical protein
MALDYAEFAAVYSKLHFPGYVTEDIVLVMKIFFPTGSHSNWHKETKS